MDADVSFGLWYDLRNPPPWRCPFEDLYSQSFAQIEWAEKLGFDSVWLTEHHFCDDGYLPAPLFMAGVIGARTKSLRIGTNLILLPLYHPVRVAEEVALLELTTGNRFDLGIGAGYVTAEYHAFGKSLKNRPSLMEESIAIMRKAWTGEAIHFTGKHFQLDGVTVQPTPTAPVKVLMGATSDPAIRRAARLCDGFLSSGGIGQDAYLTYLEESGIRRADGIICAGCWGIIAEDPDKERHALSAHLLWQTNGYLKLGAFGGEGKVPLFQRAEDAIEQGFYQFWTPQQAVDKILDQLARYPQIRDMHFWARFPGESIESSDRRVELLATKVLPKVRERLQDGTIARRTK